MTRELANIVLQNVSDEDAWEEITSVYHKRVLELDLEDFPTEEPPTLRMSDEAARKLREKSR